MEVAFPFWREQAILPCMERTTQHSLDVDRIIRRVRISQVALVTTGVVAAILPSLVQNDAFRLPIVAYSASLCVVPLAYGVFLYAVQGAVRSFVPDTERIPLLLALFAGAPCIGGLLEILLLHRLARSTARLEGARDRSALVATLAFLRGGSVWVSALFLGPFAMMIGGQAGMIALYAAGPIVSFAILGVITQIIVTPLLDQLVPATSGVRLAGAGASSSMAVPSSSGERE